MITGLISESASRERLLLAYSVEKLASYLIGVRPGAKLLRASSDFQAIEHDF